MTPPKDLIDIINEKKINIIMAPPSMLRVLMEHAGHIKTKIKMIVSYAEVLEKEEKARISSIFKSPVNEIYQASEGQIGSTCKCGSLHINEDLVFVELFESDGNPVDKPGVIASKMIVTNLINNAQPLIRYEMNDVIVLGEKCKCGSSFRVIEKILGRNDDILVLRDVKGANRNVFPDLFARWIITTDDRIREFKVVQTSTDELEITVDLYCSKDSDKCDEQEVILDKLHQRITDELQKYEIKCNLKVVSQKIPLPREKSKFKRFENRMC
jgi:putative adenylate-forming enzyme